MPDSTIPQIEFTDPTREHGNETSDTSIEINVSITELNLQNLTYNWDGTNYTLFNESLVLMMNFDNVTSLNEIYRKFHSLYHRSSNNGPGFTPKKKRYKINNSKIISNIIYYHHIIILRYHEHK